MRHFSRRRMLTSFAASTLALTVLRASSAQTTPPDFLPLLDGLVSAYARRYVPLPSARPGATPASTSISWLEVTALEFESPAKAMAAGALLNTPMILPILTGIDGLAIEDFDDAALGDRSFIHVGPFHDHSIGILLIIDGNIGYVIRAVGSDPSMKDTLLAFGAFAVDAEPGRDVVLAGYGRSSGGTWDTMPTAADTGVLSGLVPMFDYDLLVSTEPIEPEASPAA